MFSALRYGANSSIRLEWSDGTRWTECGTPPAPPLSDVRAAVAEAIAGPLEYPPLSRAIIPADRIVLCLEEGVPRAPEIVAAAVDALVAAGVDPAGITVLRTAGDLACGAPDPCDLLSASLRGQVRLLTHDPADRDRLAYLAASDRGGPILLNRAIVEADVVLPVGCLDHPGSAAYCGIHAAVFPTFSDERTQSRFRRLESHDARRIRRRPRVQECDEVGWLLGLNFTIQVVPGPGDEVLHVVAGESAAVRRHGTERYETAWDAPVRGRAALVVAAIQGPAPYQTWRNLGRALDAAISLVEPGGAIAVCCELSGEPGPAVQCLAESPSREAALRRISRECPEDGFAAAQVAAAMERADVYLLSRLDDSLVEQLQITPLAGSRELLRLVERFDSCTVLGNAPHVHVTLAED